MLLCASQFSELPILTLLLCAVMSLCGQFITANVTALDLVFFFPLSFYSLCVCMSFLSSAPSGCVAGSSLLSQPQNITYSRKVLKNAEY